MKNTENDILMICKGHYDQEKTQNFGRSIGRIL